jgi:hypothetical protein
MHIVNIHVRYSLENQLEMQIRSKIKYSLCYNTWCSIFDKIRTSAIVPIINKIVCEVRNEMYRNAYGLQR